jgi:hypothetical protein
MLEFDSIALLWSCVYVAFEIGVILASVQQAEICVYCLSVGMLLLAFLYTVNGLICQLYSCKFQMIRVLLCCEEVQWAHY